MKTELYHLVSIQQGALCCVCKAVALNTWWAFTSKLFLLMSLQWSAFYVFSPCGCTPVILLPQPCEFLDYRTTFIFETIVLSMPLVKIKIQGLSAPPCVLTGFLACDFTNTSKLFFLRLRGWKTSIFQAVQHHSFCLPVEHWECD